MSKLEPCITCEKKSLCGYEEMACMAFVGFVCHNSYYEEDKQNPTAWNYLMIFYQASDDPMLWMYKEHMKQKKKKLKLLEVKA
jgi:hypothetical protein